MNSTMEKEARSTPEKVKLQLGANKEVWQKISAKIKENPPKFAITVARGSSDHAALYAKTLFENNLNLITASAAPSAISIYHRPLSTKEAMIMAISQSGKSPDLWGYLANMGANGAETIALVNNKECTLATVANNVVPILAGEEKSVAATKSFILTLTALAQFTAIHSGDSVLEQALTRLPGALEQSCQMDWSYATNLLWRATNAYVCGRGYGFSIAQEAALKFKETSGLHAEAFSSAEVFHGPLALIEFNFPVLIFGQNDASLKSTLEATNRMIELGANTLFAMPSGPKKIACKRQLPMPPSIHPILDPILIIQSFYIMVAKLAGMRGYDPDKPSNLKKVTKTN